MAFSKCLWRRGFLRIRDLESKQMILRSVRRDLGGNKRIEKGLITQNNNTELKDEREN